MSSVADADRATDWYIEQDAWKAAETLQLEIRRALRRMAASPGLGTPGAAGTRILPIHRFPVSLVYRVQGDHIRVIAIAHQRRAPGFWRGR
ncbi:MAG: type II toxin-antitoxin system RelE/ParE family toxin [Ideonella sp.]|nr:type II toxin-antitoxin system RelE/ParE family toxin [Ideonella sp.]